MRTFAYTHPVAVQQDVRNFPFQPPDFHLAFPSGLAKERILILPRTFHLLGSEDNGINYFHKRVNTYPLDLWDLHYHS